MEKLFGYELKVKKSTETEMVFCFVSEGGKGKITKTIRFFKSGVKGIFFFRIWR